jgi:hypothetical protein
VITSFDLQKTASKAVFCIIPVQSRRRCIASGENVHWDHHSKGDEEMKTKLTILFVILSVAVFVAACRGAINAPQGKAISALTQEEATSMIDSALQAFNSGDYAAWSRDWDDAMKAAIDDKTFQDYRGQVAAQYGQYLSLESVEIQPGSEKGKVRWVAIANFENGKIKFGFGFQNDGRKVTGLFPEAVE